MYYKKCGGEIEQEYEFCHNYGHPKRKSSHMLLICILGLSIFLNFYNLAEYPFTPDEAVYTSQSAIWAGHEEYSKNFLLYSRSATNFQIHQLITSIFLRLFGVSEYVARFPSAMMGVLIVPLVYMLADTLFNNRTTALLSAFFVSINGYLIHFSRQVHLDTTLVFFMTLSVLCLVKWQKTKKNWFFYTSLASTLLMVMTKIISIFPFILLITAYLSMNKEFKNTIKMLFKPISILIILISLSYVLYYIISIVEFKNYMDTFRYAVGRESKQSGSFYISTLVLFMGKIIPIIVLIGVIQAFKNRNKEDIFCALWFIFVTIFFTYYPLQGYGYILTIVPAVGLISGRVLDDFINRFKNQKYKYNIITVFSLIIILISSYPVMSYPYETFSDPNDLDNPNILTRFDPVRYTAIKDAALWLKENVDSNSGITVGTFADHHNMAYYSHLKTYTIGNYPGFYMPVNGTAKMIWWNLKNQTSVDIFNLVKNGEIDYIAYMEEPRLTKGLIALNKTDRIEYIPIYYNNYKTPDWYNKGNLNITIFKVNRKNTKFDKLNDSRYFTIVALPDTQTYTKNKPYILNSQTQWIKDNIDTLNIKFVINTGDIVDRSDIPIQWNRAKNSFSTLDNNVPFLLVPGNDEYDGNVNSRNLTTFNSFFNYSRLENYSWYGGHYPLDGNQNNYGLFSSKDEDFLVLGLEFCPKNDAINWANDTISLYPNRKVVIYTHAYLNNKGERIKYGDPDSCVALGVDGNEGIDIWDKLIKQHQNIVLVISSHRYGIGDRIDYIKGSQINQVIQNFQKATNGGNGYLRYYTFKQSEKIIEVETYSPYLNEFDTSFENQFNFMYS